jgi:hypothetical protein
VREPESVRARDTTHRFYDVWARVPVSVSKTKICKTERCGVVRACDLSTLS